MESSKRLNTIVLDSGPIIRNDPSVSSLIAQAENLVTIPAVLTEIRDEVTRSRVETLLKPFLTVRQPSASSVKFVTDFARRTGDLAVLSKPDIQIIALTYELECERNGGDWRLRKVPGQKEINGPVPAKKVEEAAEVAGEGQNESEGVPKVPESTEDASATEAKTGIGNEASSLELQEPIEHNLSTSKHQVSDETNDATLPKTLPATGRASPEDLQRLEDVQTVPQLEGVQAEPETAPVESIAEPEAMQDQQIDLTESMATTSIAEATDAVPDDASTAINPAVTPASTAVEDDSTSDSDSDGWITPSNLKQKQASEHHGSTAQATSKENLQVAVITTDFAMQNVILQINLNLLSSSLQRVKFVRSTAMRCQACFLVSKEMGKQFCSRCGKPTLTRVSCSTTAAGEFKVHLKKNFQYNSRGDRYSIPKPVHGSSNGRIKGGGKGGWGHELILTEDQKEYERAAQMEKRKKERNLMDEDYLPGILTGERKGTGGRIKVGAGRNVNTKKR